MKKLVIFDLDGTLLNTIGDLSEAANHVMASAVSRSPGASAPAKIWRAQM